MLLVNGPPVSSKDELVAVTVPSSAAVDRRSNVEETTDTQAAAVTATSTDRRTYEKEFLKLKIQTA